MTGSWRRWSSDHLNREEIGMHGKEKGQVLYQSFNSSGQTHKCPEKDRKDVEEFRSSRRSVQAKPVERSQAGVVSVRRLLATKQNNNNYYLHKLKSQGHKTPESRQLGHQGLAAQAAPCHQCPAPSHLSVHRCFMDLLLKLAHS